MKRRQRLDLARGPPADRQALEASCLLNRHGAGWFIIGGTSAATPQWAAIDALANQDDGALGFLTPRLYQVYTNGSYSAAFHDITSGTNSFAGLTGYAAASGWDAATGLGTPDVANLIGALKATH